MCEEIHRRGIESAPDFITVDSADGGSGAAPMSLIDYMGLPIKESLPLVVDMLKRNGLRDRIKVIASGKMITPGEVAWALCVGADFVVSARGFMFALGCIQALQCNKNTCPTGVTTHDPRLQRGLDPVGQGGAGQTLCTRDPQGGRRHRALVRCPGTAAVEALSLPHRPGRRKIGAPRRAIYPNQEAAEVEAA